MRRFDRGRKDKTVSNELWESPSDPESRIARMKDGTTHLAYKAEHVIDESSDMILAAEVYSADIGDATTLMDSVMEAQIHTFEAVGEARIREVAADKGYHAAATLELAASVGIRTYIPERKQRPGSQRSTKPAELERVLRNNQRRTAGSRGKELGRRRSELAERSFAHVCETGDGRRCRLRGLETIRKRYLIQAAARNLSVILRALFGVGTPRSLQGASALAYLVQIVVRIVRIVFSPWGSPAVIPLRSICVRFARAGRRPFDPRNVGYSTGC